MKMFLYALRYVTKSRGLQSVKIVSLTLGLAVGLLIFAKIGFENSYDNFFPDRDRVYQMKARLNIDNGTMTNFVESDMLFGPMAPAMMDAVPQIESATRTAWLWKREYFHEDEFYDFQTIAGDSCLFDVLDYGMIIGDPKDLRVWDHALISETMGQRLFGNENPVGKTILYNKRIPITVRGVFRDVPRNSQVKFDVVLSLEGLDRFTGWGDADDWDKGDSFRTYVKLKSGASITDVQDILTLYWQASPIKETIREYGLTFRFHLIADSYRSQSENRQISLLIGVLAGLVLFISAMNYVLASISSLNQRTRTIAVQKCNGAHGAHIFSQFLTETILLILFSLLLTTALFVFFHSSIHQLVGEPLRVIFSGRQLVLTAVITAGFFLLAGVIPGHIFSSIPVTQAFRQTVVEKRWWKQLLLFFQILFASFVLIFLLIAVRQYRLVSKKDMGYDYKEVVTVYAKTIRGSDYLLIKQELLSEPYVEGVAFANSMLTEGLSGETVAITGTQEVISSRRLLAGSGFLELMGIPMKYGEYFPQESAMPRSVIVNERLVEMMGWEGDPVGLSLSKSGNLENQQYNIVGVVSDFHIGGMAGNPVMPLIIHPSTMEGDTTRSHSVEIHIRLHELTPDNLAALRVRLGRLLPNQKINVSTYTESVYQTASTERMIRNLVAISGLIIFLITLTGLIGYVNDEVHRRRREVAIRRIHGATMADVILITGRNLLMLGVVAIACGTLIAWITTVQFVRNFPIQISVSSRDFTGGALFILGVCLVVILLRCRHAALENPAQTIKSE